MRDSCTPAACHTTNQFISATAIQLTPSYPSYTTFLPRPIKFQCRGILTDRSTCLSLTSSISSQSKMPHKARFQSETLRPHHRRAHQSSLAPRAGANYIQGGDADVSCTACFRTTLHGVVIHMCRRHAAPTQAQVRLH